MLDSSHNNSDRRRHLLATTQGGEICEYLDGGSYGYSKDVLNESTCEEALTLETRGMDNLGRANPRYVAASLSEAFENSERFFVQD